MATYRPFVNFVNLNSLLTSIDIDFNTFLLFISGFLVVPVKNGLIESLKSCKVCF